MLQADAVPRKIADETHAVIAPAVNAVLQPWRAPDSVVLALADAIDGGSSGGGGGGKPSVLGEPERQGPETVEAIDALSQLLRDGGDAATAAALRERFGCA